MQLEEFDLPDGWTEHEEYTERMRGVVAAYRRDDWEKFIEVVELRPHMEDNLRVKLLVGDSEKAETRTIDYKDCKEYDDAKEIVRKYAEQCN